MKKVAIIMTDSLPVPAVKGGAVQTGVQQLIELNEKYKSVELTVLCISDIDAYETSKKFKYTKFVFLKPSNIQVMRIVNQINKFLRLCGIKKDIYKNLSYLKGILKTLKNYEFDIVLLQNACNLVLPLRKYVTGKLFLHLHSDFLHKETRNGERIYNCCDRIIVVSDFIRERVLSIPNSETQKIVTNKNCTDINQFNISNTKDHPKVEFYAKKYNLESHDIVVLFSGRPIKDKGIEELIDAVLAIQNINVKLLVVGSKGFGKKMKDKYLNELKEETFKHSSKIVFTGFIPYEELQYIHALCHIAVVPSLLEEPAGRVVVEAQLSSLPVIISDSGGMNEYVTNESSVIVNRGEKMVLDLQRELEKLVNDNELRKRMGKAGRIYAEQYNPERYYSEFVSFIE